MSVLRRPEAMNTPDLQIWNNAAFDNGGDSEDSAAIRSSWCPTKPDIDTRTESLDSDTSKENQAPVFVEPIVLPKSPAPAMPLHPNRAIINPVTKQGLIPVSKKIDMEIEEIEKEICRLSSRLQVLKLEKSEQNLKMVQKHGRVIPAKFMEQKKIEETFSSKVHRRGFSMGPSEIVTGVKLGQLGKQQIITPIQPIQSRRKSCFWKLQGIDEEMLVPKERKNSLSLSPKSRKGFCRSTQGSRQAVTTVGSKKASKKEDSVLASIQPKKLFKEGEKSGFAKKPLKPGRVIASRYNQSTANSAMRKRSLGENDKKLTSLETSRNQGSESGRVKKQWEIPSELVMVEAGNEKSPISISGIRDMLPRIRTFRAINDTPRDSGPAKRVAELIGRKSCFGSDEEEDEAKSLVCQTLSFAEDVEEK